MAVSERMLTCKVAVTFEFDTRPPVTWRGTVQGRAAQTIVHRAVMVARKELRPMAWSSLVCCVLERLGDEEPEEAA